MSETNWGGNHTFRAARIHRPRSTDEIRHIIETAPRLRALGSRHSFTDLPDAAELVSLSDLPEVFEFDQAAMTATVSAHMTYGRFAELARPHGIALHNLASLPHISIAGAIATATHGSGSSNGNLATAVAAVEMITSAGDVVRRRRGEAEFEAMVVGLGALGVVTELTLDVEPDFAVLQHVYESMPWSSILDSFGDVFSTGYSVSAFTRYEADVQQLWVKSRTDQDRATPEELARFLGATQASVPHHPVPGGAVDACTEQLGRPGPWSDRLPHFKLDFTPSAGAEIQSEYFVAIEHAADAINAIRDVQRSVDDVLLVGEIRTVAADELWMSPHYRRTSAAFHFTWRLDPPRADRAAAIVAEAMRPFDPRPHWAKVFPAAMVATVDLPRRDEFTSVVSRLDPRALFRNDWFERVILQSDEVIDPPTGPGR